MPLIGVILYIGEQTTDSEATILEHQGPIPFFGDPGGLIPSIDVGINVSPSDFRPQNLVAIDKNTFLVQLQSQHRCSRKNNLLWSPLFTFV